MTTNLSFKNFTDQILSKSKRFFWVGQVYVMYIIVVDNNARYVYGGSWCASPNDCTVKHTIFIFFHLGYMRGSCKVILKKVSDPLWQTHLLSPHPRKFSKSAHVLYIQTGLLKHIRAHLLYVCFKIAAFSLSEIHYQMKSIQQISHGSLYR